MPYIPEAVDCATPTLSWLGRMCSAQVWSLHHGLNLTPYHILWAREHLAKGATRTCGAGPGSIRFICMGLAGATKPLAPHPLPWEPQQWSWAKSPTSGGAVQLFMKGQAERGPEVELGLGGCHALHSQWELGAEQVGALPSWAWL